MIELKDINKKYGNHAVLKKVSLTFHKTEIVVICGPSGSGKSTLLKTINGLESISSGVIEYDRTNIATLPGHSISKNIGMVFQDFGLFANKTLIDNLVIPQTVVHGVTKEVALERAHAELEKFGMESHAHKYPDTLSGGQKQRVAIARALVTKPKYVLFDEPTSALDPEMVGDVLEAIETIAETGIGAIIVTHEMNFARHISDRMVFMDAGEILEVSPTDRFFRSPNSERAQSFLSKVMR